MTDLYLCETSVIVTSQVGLKSLKKRFIVTALDEVTTVTMVCKLARNIQQHYYYIL